MAFIVVLLIFGVFGLIVIGVLYFILQFLVAGSVIFGLTLSSLRKYLNNAALACIVVTLIALFLAAQYGFYFGGWF